MAAAVRSEEQFLCSICLEVLSEPVSTPCGHNFCKGCITLSWDNKEVCLCPLCKKSYDTRPELHINTFIQDLVSEFTQQQKNESVKETITVPCDYCTDPKLEAFKSCLVCLSSYCETHLQPHLTLPKLKSHQLMEPVDNLEDRMCQQHQKPLELFCRSEDICLCTMCALLEHRSHEFVSLKEECDRKRSFLQQSQTESQSMVEQRRLKIQEVKHCLELSQKVAKREIFAGKMAFSALIQTVQRSKDQFLEKLRENQRQIQKQAEALLLQLEQEISVLEQRNSKAEQLQHSGDHLHFLQHFTAVTPPTGLKEWSNVAIELDTSEGSVVQALSELQENLSEEFKQIPTKFELYKVQQFAVDVTLDPDTAHPILVLSEDLKQVHCGYVKNKLPSSPLRFSKSPNVLGKQSFSSGTFYFEVQVKGKSEWTVGVAQASINRKQKIIVSPDNGFWTIWLRNKYEYEACADTWISLSLKHPLQKVGVFVNYDEGLVSFYDVDCAEILFSFTGCHFRGKLLPYFDPCVNAGGKNTTPLIITAVETE